MADIQIGVILLTLLGIFGAVAIAVLTIIDLSKGSASVSTVAYGNNEHGPVTHEPDRPPRPRRLTLTRVLLLLAAISAFLRAICLFVVPFAGHIVVAYIGNAFEFIAKILVYTTLIIAKRQFFRLESPKARNLSLLADSVLIAGLACLGMASFGLGADFKIRSDENAWREETHFGPVGIGVVITFLSWLVICTLSISSTLLLKTVHARRAGIQGVEFKALRNFTTMIIPVLLFTTVVFLISLFYGLLTEDASFSLDYGGAVAILMLALTGAMIGDLLLLDAVRVAMKKLQTC